MAAKPTRLELHETDHVREGVGRYAEGSLDATGLQVEVDGDQLRIEIYLHHEVEDLACLDSAGSIAWVLFQAPARLSASTHALRLDGDGSVASCDKPRRRQMAPSEYTIDSQRHRRRNRRNSFSSDGRERTKWSAEGNRLVATVDLDWVPTDRRGRTAVGAEVGTTRVGALRTDRFADLQRRYNGDFEWTAPEGYGGRMLEVRGTELFVDGERYDGVLADLPEICLGTPRRSDDDLPDDHEALLIPLR